MMASNQTGEYIAYISYSRHTALDRGAAQLIQKQIESYTVPGDLRNVSGDKKVGIVFRNEDESPMSSILPDKILQAIEHSKYMIVIGSPERTASKWCDAELKHFLKVCDTKHVFVLLTSWEPTDSFPEELLYKYDQDGNLIGMAEPLAEVLTDRRGNLTPKEVRRGTLRVLAGILDQPFTELLEREKEKYNPLAFLKRSAKSREKTVRKALPAIPAPNVLSFSYSQPNQSIRFFQGDLTDTDQNYDVIICSAYKGMYDAAALSLIGSLESKRHISVKKLAENPELDLKDLGGWLSKPVNSQFGRLLCIELTAFPYGTSSETDFAPALKSGFLTLRHLLERASLQGTKISRIALPILGAGYQQIDLEYIAPPLYTQCVNMLKTIPTLETIDFYEIDPVKHARMAAICGELAAADTKKAPDLFISYSSAQTEYAHRLMAGLQENGIQAWIAPESIPTGSNYLAEIPRAISSVRAIVLLLTEEAQKSRWVQKEIGSAVGAGKLLLPMIIHTFPLTPEMTFLLEGEQFYPVWKEDNSQQIPAIIREVRAKLQV